MTIWLGDRKAPDFSSRASRSTEGEARSLIMSLLDIILFVKQYNNNNNKPMEEIWKD